MWLPSLSHSRPPEQRHFTVETGKTVYTFATQCTKVRFASFLSGGFTTMVVINPSERKLAKRTFVHCGTINYFLAFRYSRMNGEQIHNPGSKFALTGKTFRMEMKTARL